METNKIDLRAKLLADPGVFDLSNSIRHLNNDLSRETLQAVLGREDFDWLIFFNLINESVIESSLFIHEDILGPLLQKVDIMTLLAATKHKNSYQLWMIIIQRKTEILYKKSCEFVLALESSAVIVREGSLHSFENIVEEYFSELNDIPLAISLASKIESLAVKDILLNRNGVLKYIENLKAKEAVEIAIAINLFPLWTILLYRTDVEAYIQNEMSTSDVCKIKCTSQPMYIHYKGGCANRNNVVAYAKETNFKGTWQLVLEDENDPKVLLSWYSFLPENYLKKCVLEKESVVAYIGTLRYGAVATLLEKADDPDFFIFVISNMTTKISAVKIIHFANKFYRDDNLWGCLVKREDIKKLYRPFLGKNAEVITFQAKKHQSSAFWNFAISESKIDVATEVAIQRDSIDSWKTLFGRPDFDKDDLNSILLLYALTNNREVCDMILEFECIKKYLDNA